MIHDALVIGGGPAGSAAAILLAQAGWSVAIVEKRSFPRRKVCGEFLSATNVEFLETLGVGDAFRSCAGPDIRRVGLFVGGTTVVTKMPGKPGGVSCGRALERAVLDTLLLRRAANAGVFVIQPATAVRLAPCADGHVCEIVTKGEPKTLRARVVIAAYGSWERDVRRPDRSPGHCASDLLAFKAYFLGGRLSADLMPLLAFPGGYGGMVHSSGGRLGLSLCIRRDALEDARHQLRGRPAGDAVIGYIGKSCRGLREALACAERHGAWLAAGPVRPGIRKPYADGVFAVGNLAGEAHPIIAEGIGMAIQSSRLLAAGLIARRSTLTTESGRARAGRAYSSDWRRCFATRIRASAFLAGLAMRPGASALLPILERFPEIVTIGARLSGKMMLQPAGRAPGPEAAAPMS